LKTCITGNSFWIILLAAVFLTKPVAVIIGMVTRSFREKIENFDKNTLEKAGTWIGILERLIIFFLVLISQWEAIGLLVAAKSIIFRLSLQDISPSSKVAAIYHLHCTLIFPHLYCPDQSGLHYALKQGVHQEEELPL
jgi:hypothetical protein